jgi:hypothetical protein
MALKHAPLLFGKKNSWNMNGSDWISVIYFGFPINSIKLHAIFIKNIIRLIFFDKII